MRKYDKVSVGRKEEQCKREIETVQLRLLVIQQQITVKVTNEGNTDGDNNSACFLPSL